MRKMIARLVIVAGLLASASGLADATSGQADGRAREAVMTPSHAAPAYARWGRVAVEQTMRKFGTGIRDYRFEGAFPDQSGTVSYRFKLVLEPKPGAPSAVVCRVQVEEGRLLEVEWTESAP
ncbi:DUF3889 domain-containing protein [Paenibacillus albicereus]|uniref:DUF3889 domain-containing protein n=1 Tax=Paenibacillus albicereus TaxID=2726185 RepID=A0A6H2GXT5_9BACL|nr:DUF3889 domain-containing protein [Paenibacillus albicereus]QJC52202.1 DUF3889 domain-containing protein [Paenibacillus albicereus]